MRSPGRAMADDDDVSVESFEVFDGVFEGFAFFQRRGVSREVDDIGGEALGGEFERDARAGGGVDEKINDGFAAEGRDFFYGAFADRFKLFGGIEREDNFFGAQRLDIEKMFSVPGHARSRATESSPPSSRQRTTIRSSREVVTFLPTKSALMGSSRCPRSIRTASWTFLGRPISLSASRAALAVRPLNKTSSTKTTVLSVISAGIEVW